MLRADTGNFNRFLTSLGLVLLLGALLIPFFFFRNTDVLRISQGELREMTASARHSVEARQERIADLEVPVALLAVLLAGGGVTSLVLGGKRLRVAQSKEDEAIDRRAKRENYEIRQMSTDEVEEKRDEQAREATAEDEGGEQVPLAPPPADEVGGPPPRLRSLAETKQEIARVERGLEESLAGHATENYVFRAGVKIVSEARGARPLGIDGLFEAKSQQRPDVALELKVTRLTVRGLQNRARMFTDSLLASLARYRQLTGRDVRGWLVVVIPWDAERQPEQVRANIAHNFERELAGMGKCAVIHEDELAVLTQVFGVEFGG